MSRLSLSIAVGDYDRTRGILDGTVPIEGCDTIAMPFAPEEMFFRSLRHQAFDVSELSFSSTLVQISRGVSDYVAIPAFVSRSFRHNGIYVRRDGPIKRPEDLRGKRFGVPEYQVTAAVWVRQMLAVDHGVNPEDVDWVTGGVEDAGRREKLKIDLGPTIRIGPAPEGRALGEMLVAGEIDALTCPRPPLCFADPTAGIVRLFPEPAAAAAAYFGRHRVFPIMHLVGIRKALATQHPWLPQSVFKAFEEARRRAVARLDDTNALAVSLPFLVEEAQRTRDLMGPVPWSYGVEANLATIETLLDHHHRQGLSARRLTVEEVFHPSTFEAFKV
ncbi:ABC transporter substrate-binding protein [Humitalea sp. 24SJ18S-53]|uniref:ABC transporter substrate-binding protein n=1 Tax=Humitalea sp. 24SJ18S-53 TaxID=3422307 RepID=UPI003D671BC8